jgi:dTDP-4-amino-4,6-dideoxygalactose transaminase
MQSYWRADPVDQMRIPVARPRLPTLDEIAPYLRRIDDNRWYSNGGPLVQEFEARLASRSGPKASVATVVNATIGLALALQAQGARPGTLCMVPAWTFAATAHAILLAGLVPWMVDVDPMTWALEASSARALLRSAPGELSAVMPVSPFGGPMKTEPWESFRDETGVVVVIDAAAAFDTVRASSVPTVVSLHATKVIGIGEGGFVLSSDAAFSEEVQKRANFGFWNSREATARAVNGKISEYAAAVGLAALDGWPHARADFARVGSLYRKSLAGKGTVFIIFDCGRRCSKSGCRCCN